MSQQIPQQSSETNLWRGALIPAVAVAVISIIVGVLIRGASGLWGALLASATVILYFSVHLIISRISTNLDPMATMALAMFSYFAKVILMGALLLVVTRTTSPETVDRATFAIAALSITAAWLAGEIGAFVKLRFQLPLPQTKGSQQGSHESSTTDVKSGE
jgi:ATP synthase protein I